MVIAGLRGLLVSHKNEHPRGSCVIWSNVSQTLCWRAVKRDSNCSIKFGMFLPSKGECSLPIFIKVSHFPFSVSGFEMDISMFSKPILIIHFLLKSTLCWSGSPGERSLLFIHRTSTAATQVSQHFPDNVLLPCSRGTPYWAKRGIYFPIQFFASADTVPPRANQICFNVDTYWLCPGQDWDHTGHLWQGAQIFSALWRESLPPLTGMVHPIPFMTLVGGPGKTDSCVGNKGLSELR